MGAFIPDELDGFSGKEFELKYYELKQEGTNQFYAYENISTKKAKNMAKNFGISEYEIIGLLDLTTFGSGKYGCAFTEEEFLIHVEDLHFDLKYKDIKDIDIYTGNSSFLNKSTCMKIYLEDGRWVRLVSDDTISTGFDMYGLKSALLGMKNECL